MNIPQGRPYMSETGVNCWFLNGKYSQRLGQIVFVKERKKQKAGAPPVPILF